MIEENYCSFETAKLLKEKGFNERTNMPHVDDYQRLVCYIPTLQMAMKWLREKCIFITLDIISFNLNDLPVWSFDIWHNNNHEYRYSDYFDSYEEACEMAIKYCLKHLL